MNDLLALDDDPKVSGVLFYKGFITLNMSWDWKEYSTMYVEQDFRHTGRMLLWRDWPVAVGIKEKVSFYNDTASLSIGTFVYSFEGAIALVNNQEILRAWPFAQARKQHYLKAMITILKPDGTKSGLVVNPYI